MSALHYPVRYGWEAGTRSVGCVTSVGYVGDVDYVGDVGRSDERVMFIPYCRLARCGVACASEGESSRRTRLRRLGVVDAVDAKQPDRRERQLFGGLKRNGQP